MIILSRVLTFVSFHGGTILSVFDTIDDKAARNVISLNARVKNDNEYKRRARPTTADSLDKRIITASYIWRVVFSLFTRMAGHGSRIRNVVAAKRQGGVMKWFVCEPWRYRMHGCGALFTTGIEETERERGRKRETQRGQENKNALEAMLSYLPSLLSSSDFGVTGSTLTWWLLPRDVVLLSLTFVVLRACTVLVYRRSVHSAWRVHRRIPKPPRGL